MAGTVMVVVVVCSYVSGGGEVGMLWNFLLVGNEWCVWGGGGVWAHPSNTCCKHNTTPLQHCSSSHTACTEYLRLTSLLLPTGNHDLDRFAPTKVDK